MNKIQNNPSFEAMLQEEVLKQEQLVDVETSRRVFDSIVTRDYLHELSTCKVIPLSEKKYTKVKWFRIDKVVIEKNVFFADKLSMLYISLHKKAKNVILVLNKQKDGCIELYLGARDFSGRALVSGKVLEAGLDGYFPGLGYDSVGNLPDNQFEKPSVTSVSAIASLRDDKKDSFVQGLERLINATNSIPRFRAYFIADSVCDKEAKEMIQAFNNIYTRLAPAESLQMTYNESESKGVSESFTENLSQSISESISKTVTHTDGYSENTTEGHTVTDGTNSSDTFSLIIVSGTDGTQHSESKNYSTAIGKNFSDSEANQRGSTKGEVRGQSNQKGTNKSSTSGTSKQITYKNRTVKYYLDILDEQLKRLQNGLPFGLWSVATYFVANDSITAQQLANIYRGFIIGEESGLETCALNAWNNPDEVNGIRQYLTNSLNPRFKYYSLDVSAGSVVTSKELAIHLSLPQSSVPGILVEERASFARNVSSSQTATKGSFEIGKVMHLGRESESSVSLKLEELKKHTFITGTTGSGKSNTIYLILKSLYDQGKKFLVIEPAKGEYKNIFGNYDHVSVFGSNPALNQLLRINPFSFTDKIHVYEHIDRLVEIFNACWPMYAAMPVVLKKAITDAYQNCGWDLYTSTQNLNLPYKLFPTVKDVVHSLREFINNSEYSADTKGDYKGSLETRLVSLSEGLTGMMLNNSVNNIPDEELFEKNVIVDLSRIGNTETKSLMMGLIIMKMNEYYQTTGKMNSELSHVTVLEEAHHLLKRTSQIQMQESSNLAGKSVEMICNSIAEMRTYGEGFIIADQSPSQLDMSAIRNTNTKIIMSLPESEDRETAGKSIGLSDEQIEEIGRQKVGEAIVYQNDWEKPVQCKIRQYEDENIHDYKGEKDSYATRNNPDAKLSLLRFLYSYCDETNIPIEDLDKFRNDVMESDVLSCVKFSLLKLLKDYEANGIDLSKRNHVKVMELAGDCIGMSKEIGLILSMKKNNITEVNESIRDLIKVMFPDQSDDFYRFCIRSVLRSHVEKSSNMVEIYNNWIKLYY